MKIKYKDINISYINTLLLIFIKNILSFKLLMRKRSRYSFLLNVTCSLSWKQFNGLFDMSLINSDRQREREKMKMISWK